MVSRKQLFNLTLAGMLSIGILSACGSNGNSGNGAPGGTPADGAAATAAADTPATDGTDSAKTVDLNVWWVNSGFKGIDKDSPLYKDYAERLGVGVISPYVEWNGGTEYLNQLNLKIAAGEIPNLFQPWNGIENDLAKNGAIADLTELLPEYAPNMWKLVPEDVWNVIKANDPTGQGHIYWIPSVNAYEKTTGLIRKDWLDNLGLQMPTTQEEYVKVLKAFRDQDPNGNGKADEVPTGGRENARWMDHLFNEYGVAIVEGYPDWDVYDGELTYAAVTQNMKDALAFIHTLYQDKLLDQETFLNDKSAWDGKIYSGVVGNYYHWGEGVYGFLASIEQATGAKADYSVLPVLEAPGYEGKGFISTKRTGSPAWVVSAQQDEEHLIASLKLLDELADQSKWSDLRWGLEGMHYKVENGKKIMLPEDRSVQQNRLNPFNQFADLEFAQKLILENGSDNDMWQYEQAARNMEESQQYVKVIGGDGLPSSVYDNYPDIKNNTLWYEYATKIVIGTYPIEKFDEFVDKWYKSGGTEVTEKAREWYARVHQ
ncbi:ABC transporter substrate-binding protein [Paenibacillus sp. FSL R7-0273]|uniref:ABC transporter substrate-binding protein n=1 Tax=Paenibacillus sp. FSL R7-0273 TaxID=1536772 RepID=UPI0004F85187|nr:ABC transporter substrate-binding protein [Paenibacillus sp. FSL R7-0273]AIQ45812.1 ABC transporter substrate-binding protein [Paenibacillus sp. FSL R7-0273]OMF95341.1 ABC transporter substrate-binding protein [Paenibacillus sp. FSL R7-0273]